MSASSKIEWTDTTWNPLRGCRKVSPGCKHCYAEVFAERFRGVPGHPYEQGFDLRLLPHKLTEPFSWPTPKTVFVNSMSDLFQDEVPDSFIIAVARVMEVANWHTYQVLTKRSRRMQEMLQGKLEFVAGLPHIWWGVSVEDIRYGVPRIDDLRGACGATRFLSIEPLLEDLGFLDLTGIHWVIVGGESGQHARPMHENWVISVLSQCESMNIPFFFKQWGGVHKSKTGRTLRGRTYDEMPPRLASPQPDLKRRKELAGEIERTWVLPTAGQFVMMAS
jgi:protein gp37